MTVFFFSFFLVHGKRSLHCEGGYLGPVFEGGFSYVTWRHFITLLVEDLGGNQ